MNELTLILLVASLGVIPVLVTIGFVYPYTTDGCEAAMKEITFYGKAGVAMSISSLIPTIFDFCAVVA